MFLNILKKNQNSVGSRSIYKFLVTSNELDDVSRVFHNRSRVLLEPMELLLITRPDATTAAAASTFFKVTDKLNEPVSHFDELCGTLAYQNLLLRVFSLVNFVVISSITQDDRRTTTTFSLQIVTAEVIVRRGAGASPHHHHHSMIQQSPFRRWGSGGGLITLLSVFSCVCFIVEAFNRVPIKSLRRDQEKLNKSDPPVKDCRPETDILPELDAAGIAAALAITDQILEKNTFAHFAL